MGRTFGKTGVWEMILYLAPLVVFIGFLFALLSPVGVEYRLEWFLFGLDFRVDFVAKVFLLLTTFVWLISSFYALISVQENKQKFWFWFLVTYLGNFGLCISYDVISFYLFFSLMTFGAFGLIIHNQTQEAKEAAFVYIKFGVVGEVLILLGVFGSSFIYGGFGFDSFVGGVNDFVLYCLIIGFGIKVGMFLVHFWLPLAHANAPASASAVLSGVILKAGILGWMRFLPLGDVGHEIAGYLLITLGLCSIYGGLYGLTQNKLKSILAYSSISQMGFLVVLFGVAFLYPHKWEVLIGTVLFFAVHHGLNKSALFLLSGEIKKHGLQTKSLILMCIVAFSLIGLPFTSGAVAKDLFKSAIFDSDLLYVLIVFGSFVTALLMVRFIIISKEIEVKVCKDKIFFIVLPLVVTAILLPFVLDIGFSFGIMQIFPLLFAFVLFMILSKNNIQLPILHQGDIIVLFRNIDFNILKKEKPTEIEGKSSDLPNKLIEIENIFQNQQIVLVVIMSFIVLLGIVSYFY